MTKIFYDVYDGEIVGAESPEELVRHLTTTSFMPVEDERDFRERAAYWIDGLSGQAVRTDSDASFVEDMLAIGQYKIVRVH
jgi:hypothetical protein